jgi:translocator protein
VGLCLLVGAVDAELAAGSLATWYLSLTPPPGAPPTWLIAPVSCTAYALMGLAGWLAWRRIGASAPLRLWGWQLLASALWVPALFGLHSTLAGLVVILALWPLLLLTLRAFLRIGALATALMLPYAAWIGFATYLVSGLCWLN